MQQGALPSHRQAVQAEVRRLHITNPMHAFLFKLLVIEMVVTGIAHATIIRVPEDQPTIQGALNISRNGDTVLVAPGTYFENIIWPGVNGIKLIGSGQNQTIIDGGRLASVIRIGEKRNETIDTQTMISNLTIRNGFAHAPYPGSNGGGIFLLYSSPALKSLTIKDNVALYDGGGIWCQDSYLNLSGVTITENSAVWEGGGIKLIASQLNFDSTNRCNVYCNSAGIGSDLFNSPTFGQNSITVDTFTVKTPTDHHAFPTFSFSFNILNGKVAQVSADLFVSPNGNDNNNGLSSAEPLKRINTALAKILAEKTSPHTIFLAEGVYSRSTTGELFPLNCKSYVSISGSNESSTILDAEKYTGIALCSRDSSITIENLTMQNGFAEYHGGGFTCIESTPIINRVTVRNCSTRTDGGGLFLAASSPILSLISVIGNTAASHGGGLYAWQSNMSIISIECAFNSAASGGAMWLQSGGISLKSLVLEGNEASDSGGGIYCAGTSLNIVDFELFNNCAFNGGGLYVNGGSLLEHGIIRNNYAQNGGGAFIRDGNFNTVSVTITDNLADQNGSGFHCSSSFSASLENTLVWGATPQEIYLGVTRPRRISMLTLSYSDIQSLLNIGSGRINWWDGNISADPLFCNSQAGDYTLAADSPCIGTGRDGIDIGAFGIGCGPVSVNRPISSSPEYFVLYQNYPNPFNPATIISYRLPRRSFVNLSIYDVAGQVIEILVNKEVEPGYHTVQWYANKYVSGTYYYTIKTAEYSATRKMVFIK